MQKGGEGKCFEWKKPPHCTSLLKSQNSPRPQAENSGEASTEAEPGLLGPLLSLEARGAPAGCSGGGV